MSRKRTLTILGCLATVPIAVLAIVLVGKQRERLSVAPDFSDTKKVKLPNGSFFFSGPSFVSVRVPRLTSVRDMDLGLSKEDLEFLKSKAPKLVGGPPQELVTPHGGVVQLTLGTWDDGYRPATPSDKDYRETVNSIKADKDGVQAGQWWGNGGEGIDSTSKKPGCGYRFWSRKYTLDVGANWPKGDDEARREALETMKCAIYSVQPDRPDWKPVPEHDL